nr:hypothetical protein [Candidatus Njordarchaeum guaymaensis]
MRMLEVAEDGELKESPFRREDVDSKKVYIFVNDDEKQIILWNGKEARTRNKFIGARLASSLRLEHGLSYKLVQIDEAVDQDFIKNMGKPGERPSPPSPPVAPARREPSPPAPQVSRPTPQPQPPSVTAPARAPPIAYGQPPSPRPELDQSRIVERLNSIEIPRGFERELIVIGHDMFAVSISRTRVFGKEKTEYKVGKVTNPLEDGIFLAEGYTPRVIVENGRVLAVEFLKTSAQPKGKVEYEKPAAKGAVAEEPLESMMEKHLSEIANVFKGGRKKGEEREE